MPDKTSARDRRRAERMLRALTILNIALLLSVYFAETLIAERHWLTTLITYAPQQPLIIPPLLLLIASLLVRRWKFAALNLGAAAFAAVALLGFSIPRYTVGTPSGQPVVVMSYNIHRTADPAPIARVIKQSKADVVCLQEVNASDNSPDPYLRLRTLLPGWHSVRSSDVATFSRYPIVSQDVQPLSPRTHRTVLLAVLDVEGRRVTLLNTHLPGGARPMVAHSPPTVPYHVENSSRERSVQLSTVLSAASRARAPVIIAGDFNTPPRGLFYKRICGRYSDAFAIGGWGFGQTYRARLPVLRIDYIFVGPGAEVESCRTTRSAASDHRAVLACLSLPQ